MKESTLFVGPRPTSCDLAVLLLPDSTSAKKASTAPKDPAENLDACLRLLSAVKLFPKGRLWVSHDEEGDVLYVNFQKPSQATDSEITDNDIILRYNGGDVVGITVLYASER